MTPRTDDQYADLFDGGNDPDLERLVADLDSMCRIATAATVSPRRDTAIRQALHARALERLLSTRADRGRRSAAGLRAWLRDREAILRRPGSLGLRAALTGAILLTVGGVAGYLQLGSPAAVSAQTVLNRAAAAMRLAPNQAAHLTYNMAVTPSTDQGSAAAHDKAGSALQSTQKLQNSLSADVWVQADANGDPTMSAQTLTPGRPGLRGIGDRYIQIGQRVYAYDSSHNAILVTAGPGMQDFHPSWVVPNDALDGAGLTQELSALAQRSPQQVQLLPRQTLDGTTVDVIQINGWSDRPAQRTTFYFDAQSFLLRGFDAASFDSSYPTPSWQVRLTGYNTVAGSAVPANTFTLNAPADARIVAPAPDLSAFSTVCHSSADAKQVLAGTQSLLAACRATAPAVSEDDLVAALISPYKTALDSAVADGQITQAQAAHSFAAQQQWLDSFVTAPGGSAQGQSGRQ
ncbi:MAG TPA: hypothetical protein VFE42_15710 [Chloroflexota bacterium]|nr:hypothetical protein [Chloroflexota bacterium]